METTSRPDRPPRRSVRWLCRLVLSAALLLSALGPLAVPTAASLQAENLWVEPNGEFTLAWTDPWYPLRLEEQAIGLTDGIAIVSIVESSPLPGVGLTNCPDELATFASSGQVNPNNFIERHVSTWRAWITVEHAASGQTHYFECQVTPDGSAVAYFVGGAQASQAPQGIPALEAFVGDAVVKQPGESAPAISSDGWRVGIIEWSRGKAFGDIGLVQASAGEDYVVFVADIANWQAATSELPIDAFRLGATDGSQSFSVDLDRSNLVAVSLGEAPLEPGVPISLQPGAARRVVLVFTVDSSVGDLVLSAGDAGAALEVDPELEIFGALRPPAALPHFETGTLSNVIDGRTLLVTLADSGQSERVRLIGVGESAGEAAREFLAGYIGQNVQLERDPSHPDDARLQRYVWLTGEAGSPVMANDLLVQQGLASYEPGATPGRFDAMIASVNGLAAPTAGAGQQGLAPREDPDAMAAPELSEDDQVFLTELARSRDNLRLSLEYYDLHMASPTFDGEFYAQLGVIVLGWSVFCDGAAALQPTPQFTDLHARFLAACEPFDTLAHLIEPALDQVQAGQPPEQPFAGFDYDVMSTTVAAARPGLEQILAEIDALLEAAGITLEAGPVR